MNTVNNLSGRTASSAAPLDRNAMLSHWLTLKGVTATPDGRTVARSMNYHERMLARRLVWPVEYA